MAKDSNVSHIGEILTYNSGTDTVNLLATHVTTNGSAPAGVSFGAAAAGTAVGSVVKKAEIFNATGTSLGYIAIYDAIT